MEITDPTRIWRELMTSDDVAELMRLFGNFHDGCVRELHVATGHFVSRDLSMTVDWRTTVHMLVQRQVRELSAIELRFDEVIALRVTPPAPDYASIIYRAAFFLREGIYYWAESDEWEPDGAERDDLTWIAARRVAWRDANEWMGPTVRY